MPAERMIGNYLLGAIIGRGGMSCVHAAEHRFLGDRVAVKLLRPHLACDQVATAAFLAEATRTRAIDHPNVVRVIDFGSDGDDLYLVMELLDGESLAARLARVTRLDEAEVRRLGAAIADGVAAAHDRGIVHRDLKPGNVVMSGDRPTIVDFGIARSVDAAAHVTGSRIGTLAYMAPEQLTGGLIAPCVDVWALGVMLYEALAGRLPFDDFTGGRLPQLLDTPPPLAAVSPALARLLAACLERDPGKRPPSMHAIARALREAPDDQRFTEVLPPSIGLAGELGPAPEANPAGLDSHRAARVADPAIRPRGRLADHAPDPAGLDARGDAHVPVPPIRPRGRHVTVITAGVAAAVIAAAWMLHAHNPDTPGMASSDQASGAATGLSSPMSPTGPVAPARTGPAERPEPGAGTSPAASGPAPTATESPRRGATAVTIEVRSTPAGAAVLVDGKRVGITPATIALTIPAAIVVTRAGYRPARVVAERAGPIDVPLVRARRSRVHRPAAGETLD